MNYFFSYTRLLVSFFFQVFVLPCNSFGLTRTILIQMVGRGKARATRAGPAETPEASDQTPQYVIDILARMQAMEERFADSSASVPHRQPVIHPVAQPVASVLQQAQLSV